MQLKSIRLAGFKTFVDPVAIPLSARRIAVVGPNGGGKSNMIDAMRWVLGTNSPKHLRGESSADVIFNGSSGRKPISKASVELLFDNSEGRLGGEYAAYQEISIKRQIFRDEQSTRQGKSTYYFNGSPCRRSDIIDIFLGTGLGTSNYAIIEQNSGSDLVDAKPEVLRAAIEEASGISKYKVSRHETELRIAHTRENLARLDDLRQEIAKQLTHLQKQANAANRYTQLKEEERAITTALFNLRAYSLNAQLEAHGAQVQAIETEFEMAHAESLQFDVDMCALREQLHQLQENFTQEQAILHETDIELAKLLQAQQHQAERKSKLALDEEQAMVQCKEAEQQMLVDEALMQQFTKNLADMQALLAEKNQQAQFAQEEELTLKLKMQEWQKEWDAFQKIASEAQRKADVEQMRASQLQAHLNTLLQQGERLKEESIALKAQTQQEQISFSEQLENLQAQIQAFEGQLTAVNDSINMHFSLKQQLESEIRAIEQDLQRLRESYASLEALQKVALGQQNSARVEWLRGSGLSDKPRLAQLLNVTPGWERALEVVLGFHLEAVCLETDALLLPRLNHLPDVSISLLTPSASDTPIAYAKNLALDLPLLADYVQAAWSLGNLLLGIYVAENLEEAWSIRHKLKADESIVTPEGVWLGSHWLRVQREADEKMGLIQRERELLILKEKIGAMQSDLATKKALLEEKIQVLAEQARQKQHLQQQLNTVSHQQAEIRGQWQAQQTEHERVLKRFAVVEQQRSALAQEQRSHEESLEMAKEAYEQAIFQINQQRDENDIFLKQREAYQTALTEQARTVQTLRQNAHEVALKVESLTAQIDATSQHAQRLYKQLHVQKERLAAIKMEIEQLLPSEDSEERFQALEVSKNRAELLLVEMKQQLAILYQQETDLVQKKANSERVTNKLRDQLEEERLAQKSAQERFLALQNQMFERGCKVVLEQPIEIVDESSLEKKLEQVQKRVENLGAINLAAVEELKVCQERKDYLENQNNDLVEALALLESAILKIDNETRQRFKETFDAINVRFKDLFPKLFGGGQASLALLEQNWLTSGVQVMAQPPGKRNSTVHLLSGGEKALTAIALVFSFFELNPAPFCILDEIDAPLDDANVARFCALLKEMSDRVQFIFVTHNKLAMEMAQHLIGVTMHEPGVSRFVAVDIEQAMNMVNSEQPQEIADVL